MRVLVTGASGFVGTRLVRHLEASGHEVWGTVLDPPGEGPGRDRLLELDLRSADAVERVLDEVAAEAIVHLAGLSHVGRSWSALAAYYQANVVGTRNVLAAGAGARIVVASSAEIYGLVPQQEQPIAETREAAPQSPYALTKAAAELLALPAGAIVVRSFNLVGPGQSTDFALPTFAEQLALIHRGRQEPVLAVGNLAACRDFLHVDDALTAYALLLERGEPGSIYNLGSGSACSIEEALHRLMMHSGVRARIEQDPGRLRPIDIPLLVSDCSRLQALGWRPQHDLDTALAALWTDTLERVSAPARAEAT
jgi:GDP-4-dehydro-6-deoxy-D-mannose reductase